MLPSGVFERWEVPPKGGRSHPYAPQKQGVTRTPLHSFTAPTLELQGVSRAIYHGSLLDWFQLAIAK